jgi:hypothetical protein
VVLTNVPPYAEVDELADRLAKWGVPPIVGIVPHVASWNRDSLNPAADALAELADHLSGTVDKILGVTPEEGQC